MKSSRAEVIASIAVCRCSDDHQNALVCKGRLVKGKLGWLTGLENGVNPAVAADQLGHSVKMFFEVCSKWINAMRREEELKKMDGSKRVLESVSEGLEGKAKLLKLN